MSDAKFPKTLLSNLVIVFVNTLAIKSNQYVMNPGGGASSLPNFSPDFITGGGVYSQTIGNVSFIYINSKQINNLKGILTHELGHYIGSKLTDAEWTKYYQLRNIPPGTSRQNSTWQISPFEDFAEAYKNTYTDLPISTVYGLIVKSKYVYTEPTCGSIYDSLVNEMKANYEKTHPTPTYNPKNPFTGSSDWWNAEQTYMSQNEINLESDTKLQDCRRNVMLNPDKYPKDFQYAQTFGNPYYTTVSQATKDFIKSIITRLGG